MSATFVDRQELSNPMNGTRINNKIELDDTIDTLLSREPFFFELVGDYDFKLLVGLGNMIGCVQYSRTDGDTPYLMAMAPGDQDAQDYVEFLTANTPTPVSKRYCLPLEQVRQIAAYFLETGDRSPDVSWEEI